MDELMELNELVNKFNEGSRPLISWMKKHMDDPFFETKDGKDILDHTAMIAKGGILLNLKTTILLVQEAILDREAAKRDEEQ